MEELRPRGFTIIETTVVLCLIVVLTAIATPGFGRVIDTIEVREAAMEIETAFAGARHLAIDRAAQAFVEIDATRRTVSVRVGADTLRTRDLSQHHVDIQTTKSSMSYSPIGVGYGAANLTVTVRRNAAVDSVIVSRLGRVRR